MRNNEKGVEMLKSLMLLGFSATVMFAQQATTWVPYSAKFTEIVNETDSSGHTVIHEEKSGEEFRSSDGSQLKVFLIAGQRTKGQLWQGCGQQINLDYFQKKASLGPSTPRRHPQQSPDPAQGTMTLGGVEFTAYPVHMQESSIGSGTVWVNMEQDIMAKLEIHVNLPTGGHQDSVRTLTSLDLNSPVDDSQMKVPPEFAIEKGKLSTACASSAPRK
jgi:hypothetical protein